MTTSSLTTETRDSYEPGSEPVTLRGVTFNIVERLGREDMQAKGHNALLRDWDERGIRAWVVLSRPAGQVQHLAHELTSGHLVYVTKL